MGHDRTGKARNGAGLLTDLQLESIREAAEDSALPGETRI